MASHMLFQSALASTLAFRSPKAKHSARRHEPAEENPRVIGIVHGLSPQLVVAGKWKRPAGPCRGRLEGFGHALPLRAPWNLAFVRWWDCGATVPLRGLAVDQAAHGPILAEYLHAHLPSPISLETRLRPIMWATRAGSKLVRVSNPNASIPDVTYFPALPTQRGSDASWPSSPLARGRVLSHSSNSEDRHRTVFDASLIGSGNCPRRIHA